MENPEKNKCQSSTSENGIEKKTVESSEAVAKGLSSMLTDIIKDFDAEAQKTFASQDQLSEALDRLTRELDKLLEDAPLPFIVEHAAKITGVRQRVLSLNSVLKSVQRRLDNIDRMMSVGVPRQQQQHQPDKMATEQSGQQ